MKKGTPIGGHYPFDTIPVQFVYEIAKIKKELDPELGNVDLREICYMIRGQLTGMNIGIAVDFFEDYEKENPPLKI